jgi:hypothetical protein
VGDGPRERHVLELAVGTGLNLPTTATPVVRCLQRLVNPLTIRILADDLLRDPVHLAVTAGFEVLVGEQAGTCRLPTGAPGSTAPGLRVGAYVGSRRYAASPARAVEVPGAR